MHLLQLKKNLQMKKSTAGDRRNFASGHHDDHGKKHDDHHGHDHGHDSHGHGHDDHHHHEPFEVPNYTKFNNWSVSPELSAHQRRLNVLGLSDPWVRNHAWQYTPEARSKAGLPKLRRILFGGFKYGAIVAGVAIAGTEGYYYYKKTHASGDDEHHQEHH